MREYQYRLLEVKGRIADESQFTDRAMATAHVDHGLHRGHKLTLSTAKHNCGAYEEELAWSGGGRCPPSFSAAIFLQSIGLKGWC